MYSILSIHMPSKRFIQTSLSEIPHFTFSRSFFLICVYFLYHNINNRISTVFLLKTQKIPHSHFRRLNIFCGVTWLNSKQNPTYTHMYMTSLWNRFQLPAFDNESKISAIYLLLFLFKQCPNHVARIYWSMCGSKEPGVH